MQYKIPVQIENEDTIFLGLSLRQLGIIVVGGGLGYSIFQNLSSVTEPGIAAVPAVIVALIWAVIALFKNSEMTFLPFILNLIRLNLNTGARIWSKWTDSFSVLEIGHVVSYQNAQAKVADKVGNNEAFSGIENKLHKL